MILKSQQNRIELMTRPAFDQHHHPLLWKLQGTLLCQRDDRPTGFFFGGILCLHSSKQAFGLTVTSACRCVSKQISPQNSIWKHPKDNRVTQLTRDPYKRASQLSDWIVRHFRSFLLKSSPNSNFLFGLHISVFYCEISRF